MHNTKEDLFLAFSKIFNAIKPETCQSLVASMPDRMKKVISAKGKNIKYFNEKQLNIYVIYKQ